MGASTILFYECAPLPSVSSSLLPSSPCLPASLPPSLHASLLPFLAPSLPPSLSSSLINLSFPLPLHPPTNPLSELQIVVYLALILNQDAWFNRMHHLGFASSAALFAQLVVGGSCER